MEKLSYQVIPELIICNSGYVTTVTPPDESEETADEKPAKKQTTARKPELITLDAGNVTRVGGQLVKT